jgi:formate hydrogenlyase subunit 4
MVTADKTLATMAFGITVYLLKITILAVLLPIGETAVAKMRVFRYPSFLGGAFAIAALAVFLLFVSREF